MFRITKDKDNEIRNHIIKTIEIIEEYLDSKQSRKSEIILDRIKLYVREEEYLFFLLRNPDIAERLLDAIYKYIKFRHIEIRDIIEFGIPESGKPSIFTKMLYEAARKGHLVIPAPPVIPSITISAINRAIEYLSRSPEPIIIEPQMNKELGISDYFYSIVDKRETLSRAKKMILRELSGDKIRLTRNSFRKILKFDGRPVGYKERKWRLLALINLLVEGIKIDSERDD